MDDMKLFVKKWKTIRNSYKQLKTIRIYSLDIEMDFIIEKSAMFIMKIWKR